MIPFGSVGSKGPKSVTDLFGKQLQYQKLDDRHVELVVEAHQSYLIECNV